MPFERISDGIYRVQVPFDDIHTAVFILTDEKKCFLLDCAASQEDVKNNILPALQALGLVPDALILSHSHGDHAGGADALLATFPDMQISFIPRKSHYPAGHVRPLSDGERLGRFEVMHLPGHDMDCLGILDHETGTLLSADCLQLGGVSHYGVSIVSYPDYLATIERVRRLPIRRLIASHDYVPLGCNAEGADAIGAYLDECARKANEIYAFTQENAHLSPEAIAQSYNAAHEGLPPIAAHVPFLMLKAVKKEAQP